MQAAVAIIAHALRMLIFETGTTLRVLMPALLIVLGSSLLAALLTGDTLIVLQTDPQRLIADPPDNLLLVGFLGLAGLVGYALMAILWHRHVLLSGMDRGQVMRPNAGILAGYILKAITLGLVQFVASIPIVLGMGALITLGGGSAAAIALSGLLGSLAFIWIALRLSLILPAAALGERMTILDSWEASAQASGTMFWVAALLTGLNWAAYSLVSTLIPGMSPGALIVQTLFYILEGLVFVSVLTTFYGHLVEGRSLD